MVSDGGAKRYWLLYIALGLIFLAGSSVLFSWTWDYVSPREPDVVGQKPPQGPEANYQPGGAGCEPTKLWALRSKGAQRERDRCAQAREEHRIEQENLNQQVRSVDLSERNLRLAERQARSAVVTTLATVAAFIAAALAAIAAFFAVYHAKRSADADNETLKETRRGMEEARADAAQQADRFRQQIKIAKDSAEATRAGVIAADRAWLKLNVKISGPLIFEGDEVSIDLTCVCQNVGRSPALGVIWNIEMYGSIGDYRAAIHKGTQHTVFAPGASFGTVMYPSDRIKRTSKITMSRSKFIAGRDALADISYPNIVASAHYAIPGDDLRRFTYLAYYIKHLRGGDGSFDGSDGRFEVDEVALRPDSVALPAT